MAPGTDVQVLYLGVDFVIGDLTSLGIGAMIGAATVYAASVLPSQPFSTAVVRLMKGLFNASWGLIEASSPPVAVLTIFGILLTVVGTAMTGYGLYGDIPKAVDVVEIATTITWSLSSLVLFPAISTALACGV